MKSTERSLSALLHTIIVLLLGIPFVAVCFPIQKAAVSVENSVELLNYSVSFCGVPVGKAMIRWSRSTERTEIHASMQTNTFASGIFSIDNEYGVSFEASSGSILSTECRIEQDNISFSEYSNGKMLTVDRGSLLYLLEILRNQSSAEKQGPVKYEFSERDKRFEVEGKKKLIETDGKVLYKLTIRPVGDYIHGADLLRNHMADPGNRWTFVFSGGPEHYPLEIVFRKGLISASIKLKDVDTFR